MTYNNKNGKFLGYLRPSAMQFLYAYSYGQSASVCSVCGLNDHIPSRAARHSCTDQPLLSRLRCVHFQVHFPHHLSILRSSTSGLKLTRSTDPSHHTLLVFHSPFSSDRQCLSYDDCLEVRGEIIRTVLCCIVY